MVGYWTEQQQARAALELRKRRRMSYTPPPLPEFLARTQIKTPHEPTPTRPFCLWPSQLPIADLMVNERLLVILKARQLGISWMSVGYALWECVKNPGAVVLLFSQGQIEANELISRAEFMHDSHADDLPRITASNTTRLQFENGSVIRSLPATKKAGRSFTASLVVLDEYAFMQWSSELYAAVKPTIDNGGKLIVVSSADYSGSEYHQFWQSANAGENGFTAVFLPWNAHPARGEGWRDARLTESANPRDVKREYPESAEEAFSFASGLVYEGVWSPQESVTEKADFVPDGGDVYWAIDDGYSAGSRFKNGIDPSTRTYTADAHPRVVLLCQLRRDGTLVVFDEVYRCLTVEEAHIAEVLELGYPRPVYAAIDSSAAQLRGRLPVLGVGAVRATHRVEEGIKELRRRLAADENNRRMVLVHPRCKHLVKEMVSYVEGAKAFDHGPDALRYLVWTLRYRE
ncbi:MAG: hypothetical protein KDD89_00375 [Anaerolineales bacterium]|nr:hypothetical protein [Anaerolineales bacterium]